jgi:hypothetical protein
MSPPNENVGIVKHLVGKTTFGIVKGSGSYLDIVTL